MSDNSSRIAVSNILTPLASDVERERRLIEAGESFDQRHKETIEHDRDELRRSGIVAADWTPNETNADHGYWDVWSERLRKVAGELKAAGETEIAGQVLTFCKQIDDRDEVTCESDFRFEELAKWLAAVMDGDKKEVSRDGTPPDPECFVTLLQAASMVNKTKNTLEKRAKKSPMPLPDVEGGGGTAAEWKWSAIRPWLEKEFKRQLPEHFPSDRFIRR